MRTSRLLSLACQRILALGIIVHLLGCGGKVNSNSPTSAPCKNQDTSNEKTENSETGKDPGKKSTALLLADTIGYSDTIKSFLDKQCVSCHKAGGSRASSPLDTYENAKKYAKESLGRMKDAQNPMPPSGVPSSSDVEKFNKWITSNFPQSGSSSPSDTTGSNTKPSTGTSKNTGKSTSKKTSSQTTSGGDAVCSAPKPSTKKPTKTTPSKNTKTTK